MIDRKSAKIRTVLAINNCFMRQQAFIETREIWRAQTGAQESLKVKTNATLGS